MNQWKLNNLQEKKKQQVRFSGNSKSKKKPSNYKKKLPTESKV